MRACVALSILILVPTVSHSMKRELPNWLTTEKFEEQKSSLQLLREKSEEIVRRQTEKLCCKIDRDRIGNAKHLIKEIVFLYKRHHENPELLVEKNTNNIRTLIGKKFSNLPGDPNSSIGALLWLKQKKRDHFLKNYLRGYLSNPQVFAKTAFVLFYRKQNTDVFL